MLEAGANADAKRKYDGETALMRLLWVNGDVQFAKLLVDKGADVNAKLKPDGTTALLVASITGRNDIAKILLGKGADLNVVKSPNPWYFYRIAEMVGDQPFVEMLYSRKFKVKLAGNGMTPLLAASVRGHVDMVGLYLDKGADANATISFGGDDWSILKVVKKVGRSDIAKMLVAAGAKD